MGARPFRLLDSARVRRGWVGAAAPITVSGGQCAYCGVAPTPYQTALADEPATSVCPLCGACLSLNRPRIDDEFVLIWLPEIAQPAINILARSWHLIFHAHGEPAHMTQRPRMDTPALRAAWRAFHAMLTLVPVVTDHVPTTSPHDLGAALMGLSAAHAIAAERQLHGVRLLPLGRYYRDGQDIYPAILTAWATPGEPGHPSPF